MGWPSAPKWRPSSANWNCKGRPWRSKGSGTSVRRNFLSGAGINSSYAVEQDDVLVGVAVWVGVLVGVGVDVAV